jgi:DNA-binding NtrC family response regulator
VIHLAVIDDHAASLEFLEAALAQDGLSIHAFSDPLAALDYIYDSRPQIVLTDMMMPGISGLELIERVVAFDPSIDVILVTAHYTTESAVEAIRKGAADYLDKPITPAALRQRLAPLIEKHRQAERNRALEETLASGSRFHGMVGNSPAMWDVFSQVRRVAPHYRSVLIQGATGTGKELIARTLHELSPVAKGQFVALNCSAVVETLFESELFGHVKGAFTGAAQDKVGLFEFAHEGTLFLDEIGDMPLATQAKLLRVLQNQEVQRLGSLTARKVNVRVIAATHQDLRAKTADKTFREDLFYRLSMVELALPPLTEREGDLRLLVHHFVAKFSALYGKPLHGLTNRALIVLGRHGWPGNVRELENVIGHAAMMVTGTLIDTQDLPHYLQGATPAPLPSAAGELPSLEAQERALLLAALNQANQNQSEAARRLRISRDTLRYRMKKHGL